MRAGNSLKKICRYRLKGSFTIEASVIVPMVMLIMLSLILLTFYIHDRALLTSASISAILENASERSDIGALKSEAEQRIHSQLIAAYDIYVSADSNDGSFSISASGDFDWKNSFVRAFLNNSPGSLDVRVNISNLGGREPLLQAKVLSDAARLIKGS